MRLAIVLVAVLGVAVSLTACSSSGPADPRSGARVVHVVAGENMWGDIVRQLGGRHVAVTSLISDPTADPHLYETSPQAAATIASANLVIVNGAGYDDFLPKLLGASPDHGRGVLTVARVLHVHGADPNPHLWYDIPRVPAVAAAIVAALIRQDPHDAPLFKANLKRFDASLKPLRAMIAAIRTRSPGAPVAYTERVAGYLLADAGLTVRTPSGFARAIEDGNDPSPADSAAMDALVTGRQIKVLLDNAQAASPVTERVQKLAERAHVPVVAVTETLPPSEHHYQAWQLHQAQAIERALR